MCACVSVYVPGDVSMSVRVCVHAHYICVCLYLCVCNGAHSGIHESVKNVKFPVGYCCKHFAGQMLYVSLYFEPACIKSVKLTHQITC